MLTPGPQPVRCTFAVRYPAGNGKWRYKRVHITGVDGDYCLPLWQPPIPGDKIDLWSDQDIEGGPVFLVAERAWSHAAYGSPDWPYGSRMPGRGPLLHIIVEPSEGPYHDEAPGKDMK